MPTLIIMAHWRMQVYNANSKVHVLVNGLYHVPIIEVM